MIDARDLLRERRAHAARREHVLRIDGADARGRREHDGEEAVDTRKGDLRFRADAEPSGEDRIEDDDRHRVEAREHRQQEVAQQRHPANQRADEDAGAAGDHHRDARPRRASRRAPRCTRTGRCRAPPASSTARAGTAPGSLRSAASAPRTGAARPGSASAWWRGRGRSRIGKPRLRALADLLPDAVAKTPEDVGRHHLVGARPRQGHLMRSMIRPGRADITSTSSAR